MFKYVSNIIFKKDGQLGVEALRLLGSILAVDVLNFKTKINWMY